MIVGAGHKEGGIIEGEMVEIDGNCKCRRFLLWPTEARVVGSVERIGVGQERSW